MAVKLFPARERRHPHVHTSNAFQGSARRVFLNTFGFIPAVQDRIGFENYPSLTPLTRIIY